MPKANLINSDLMEAARNHAEKVMNDFPFLRERWLNQCRLSEDTKRLGYAKIINPNDWVLAFLLWKEGVEIPRDPVF